MKGVVVAGTASGVGKTVATLGVIQALNEAGYAVQPAKAGPDFIDPSHHAVVAERPSRTLDVWMEGREGLLENYYRGEGDICVVEGVMGLYDGSKSSTAIVAETLELPVILVVDAKAGMESVAATALGFREYAKRIGRDIDVVGIIAQRAHGGRHAEGIRDALPEDLAYFGRIPPGDEFAIPERHLGLHMGDEAPLGMDGLRKAGEHLAVEQIAASAQAPPAPAPAGTEDTPRDVRIAVAQDAAFRFIYPATRERLRALAEVETFAPTAGDDLPACDGVYLPGGYPELHLDELAGSPALESLHDRCVDGLPVFGECGGMMVLAESLTTTADESVEMAGILPAAVRMHDRYQALDHVALTATRDTLTAGTGTQLTGHEFHYSSAAVDADARFAFEVTRGEGIDGNHDGLTEHQTLGTYCHVHSTSGAFDTFLETVERQ